MNRAASRVIASHAGTRLGFIAQSFHALTGGQLAPPGIDPAAALWDAPRVIVAHGTEADPVFFYGNRMALELFDISAEAFIRLPSRLSAGPAARAERDLLLARVARRGFIDDYAGIRISAQGQRFRIERAIVWNLTDDQGGHHGQAATFDQWVPLDAGGQ